MGVREITVRINGKTYIGRAEVRKTLADFIREHPHPTEREIREALAGNLCRCTGYQNIVKAVAAAAEMLAAGRSGASGGAAGDDGVASEGGA